MFSYMTLCKKKEWRDQRKLKYSPMKKNLHLIIAIKLLTYRTSPVSFKCDLFGPVCIRQ